MLVYTHANSLYTHTQTHTLTYVLTHAHTRTHLYTLNTHKHTYIQIHIHTHTYIGDGVPRTSSEELQSGILEQFKLHKESGRPACR